MSKHARALMALAAPAALMAGLLSAPSVAQQGAVLEEVVVTAQRRETIMQETPVAVTAFDGDKIVDLGIFDLTDVSALAPNTIMNKQPASNSNAGVRIRGVGTGETSLLVDPKVGVYIDGVYMSKTVGAVFDIVDIESLEVLRGPQGTLFGRNSTGGALNITTAKPSGELGARVSASVGNDGYRRYAGSVDLPGMGDMFSAKLSGMLMDYDGWAKNTYPGGATDLGGEDNSAFRVALRFAPTDNFTVDYSYDDTNNEGPAAPFQILAVKDSLYNGFTTTPFPFAQLGGPYYQQLAATVGNPEDRQDEFVLDNMGDSKLDVEGHTLIAELDLESVTLKYIFGDRSTKQRNEGTDLDAGAYVVPDLFYGRGQPVPTPGFHALLRESRTDMTTHELQLFGAFADDRVDYTLGFYHYEEEVRQDNPQTFSLPVAFMAQDPTLAAGYFAAGFCNFIPGVGPVCVGSQRLPLPFPSPGADPNGNGWVDFVYGQDSQSWALYGQATVSLSDQLELTGGLRYTEDEKKAFLFNENLGMVSFDQRLTNKQDWDNLSYLVNLNFAATDDMNIYATYSSGYNAGGFNARASNAPSFSVPVNEEEVTALELGLKADWLDNRVRTNIAFFHNKFDDLQIAQFEAGSGGASSRLVNAATASYTGIEVDLIAILAEGLIADVTYGYLEAQFDKYLNRNPATDQEADIADITTAPGAPDHTAAIGLQYDFAPFSKGRLSLRVDAVYRDEIVFHPFQNQYDSSSDYWLLNARLSLNDIPIGGEGRLRISAWAKNLGDNEYREWGIDFASLGFAGATWGRPRTYGIDVVYQLGN